MRSTNTALAWQTASRQRVLLVDRDGDGASSVTYVLASDGYVVEPCKTTAEAFNSLNERPADVIVVDTKGARDSAREVASFAARLRADPVLGRIPIVAVYDHGKTRPAGDVSLIRPFSSGDLLVAIERALLRAERRALAERLEQTERLAMLGTIAASIGHELNNPLTFAMGNLDLADDVLEALGAAADALGQGTPSSAPDRLRQGLQTLGACLKDGRCGLRCVRTMIADLAALTRRRSAERHLVDVRRVLESSLRIAKGQISDHAIVTCEYGETSEIMGDEPRLGQLFLNLLVNAAQAIPPGHAASNSIHVVTYQQGPTVVVHIEDTGGGMSKTQLSRIFEPFFTTKAESGTGLGLPICRSIVEEHGGDLEVESELGSGSRFTVRLPAVPDAR
jgi:two-component system NtrC family sensor kinase